MDAPDRNARFDGIKDRLAAEILTTGWGIVAVLPSATQASYSYTCGFTATLGVPEVVLVGLSPRDAGGILNALGDRLRALPPEARAAALTDRLDGLMEPPFSPGFRPLDGYPDDTFAMGQVVLGVSRHPVVQMLYPDRENHLPGEPDCDAAFEAGQAWPPARA